MPPEVEIGFICISGFKGNEGRNGDYILKLEYLELKNTISEMKIFLSINTNYILWEKRRELDERTVETNLRK